jgi:flavin-dependent dehydrogenase
MSDYELIIIGGGPAGATASITALRDGMSVLIFESAGKRRFRPGETLAPGTVNFIGNLFGHDVLMSLPGLAYHDIVTRDRRGERSHADDFSTPGMHFLRADLDEALLRAAVRGGRKCTTRVQPPQSKLV